jgi:hypothetical protein
VAELPFAVKQAIVPASVVDPNPKESEDCKHLKKTLFWFTGSGIHLNTMKATL